ncbi:MAG TPA: VOC family protein [Terriglobia bacterium]|nr:VOC family protein [Terriglobia bacterium]
MSNSENNLRIDYVEFPTTDIEASKRFYAQVFGWKLEDYGPE